VGGGGAELVVEVAFKSDLSPLKLTLLRHVGSLSHSEAPGLP